MLHLVRDDAPAASASETPASSGFGELGEVRCWILVEDGIRAGVTPQWVEGYHWAAVRAMHLLDALELCPLLAFGRAELGQLLETARGVLVSVADRAVRENDGAAQLYALGAITFLDSLLAFLRATEAP